MSNECIKKKLDNLDLLRFVSSICIVLFHYNKFTGTTHSDLNFPFFNIFKYMYVSGGNLVELFFIISGFTFFCIYEDRIRNKKINGKEFLIKRVLRLFPLYWFTTFFIMLVRKTSVKLFKKQMFGGGY